MNTNRALGLLKKTARSVLPAPIKGLLSQVNQYAAIVRLAFERQQQLAEEDLQDRGDIHLLDIFSSRLDSWETDKADIARAYSGRDLIEGVNPGAGVPCTA